MENVNPTRMELLAVRGQIALAEQGRDLLKQKRAALLREFLKIANVVMLDADELEREAMGAQRALARAQALDGSEAVCSAAFAAQRELSLSVEAQSVMGVPILVIEKEAAARDLIDRGYALSGTSTRIDDTAACFEREVDLLVEFATSELCLRRLADEIRKTSSRVNALDNVLIPRLPFAPPVYCKCPGGAIARGPVPT